MGLRWPPFPIIFVKHAHRREQKKGFIVTFCEIKMEEHGVAINIVGPDKARKKTVSKSNNKKAQKTVER